MGCAAETADIDATVAAPPSMDDNAETTGNNYFADDDYYDQLTSDSSLAENFEGGPAGEEVIYDPLESWNRFLFGFNDLFIEYAAKPVNTVYEFITPAFMRQGINNFFKNLRAPVRMINCLLQGKGQETGVEFSSFIINSVWGLGGLFNPAADNTPVTPATGEDFGQTLGSWGLGEGLYLVLPFMGPSNLRDILGVAGEYEMGVLFNPIPYISEGSPYAMEIGRASIGMLNNIGSIIRVYDGLKSIAIDPYIAMRDGYTKLRRDEIAR